MSDKNHDHVKNALIQAELADPVQNIIDLADHIFETIDGFNTELTIHDLQTSIGKLKKYHEFNKLLVSNARQKQ